jgi:hypothetical protein
MTGPIQAAGAAAQPPKEEKSHKIEVAGRDVTISHITPTGYAQHAEAVWNRAAPTLNGIDWGRPGSLARFMEHHGTNAVYISATGVRTSTGRLLVTWAPGSPQATAMAELFRQMPTPAPAARPAAAAAGAGALARPAPQAMSLVPGQQFGADGKRGVEAQRRAAAAAAAEPDRNTDSGAGVGLETKADEERSGQGAAAQPLSAEEQRALAARQADASERLRASRGPQSPHDL